MVAVDTSVKQCDKQVILTSTPDSTTKFIRIVASSSATNRIDTPKTSYYEYDYLEEDTEYSVH